MLPDVEWKNGDILLVPHPQAVLLALHGTHNPTNLQLSILPLVSWCLGGEMSSLFLYPRELVRRSGLT
jgi:hypothetical protein